MTGQGPDSRLKGLCVFADFAAHRMRIPGSAKPPAELQLK